MDVKWGRAGGGDDSGGQKGGKGMNGILNFTWYQYLMLIESCV